MSMHATTALCTPKEMSPTCLKGAATKNIWQYQSCREEQLMADKRVLVLGAGIAGITCALELANQNIPVYLAEKEKDIGGLVSSFSCKATDKCNNCGVCLLNEKIKKMKDLSAVPTAQADRNNIILLTSCRLQNVEKELNNFNIKMVQEEKSLSIKAEIIVVATGAEVFDARYKTQFGYKRYKGVITGLDLEERLRAGSSQISFNGDIPKSIAFIQCVGSRDEKTNKGYCSKVCCKYALRMADVLQSKIEDLKVTVFYMDLQSTGKDFSSLYERCKEDIEFINSIPAKIEEEDEKLKVKYENIESGKIDVKNFDLVVLSTGLSPNKENSNLARMLKINRDEFGFFEAKDSGETNIDGIYACGTCISPKNIVDSISSAKVVAGKIIKKNQK